MKTTLLTSCLVTMILSLLAFYIGGAVVAAAVSGEGQTNASVDNVFAVAKVLLTVSALCGIAGWLTPEPPRKQPPAAAD